jgi:glycosyltransferase involved in cell wall biosynthesis
MKVSVIMPAFNAARFIDEAIQSVLAQRPPAGGFELLIGDDASTDATAAGLERYRGDSRVRLFRTPVTRGAAATRNALLRAARGEYVTP